MNLIPGSGGILSRTARSPAPRSTCRSTTTIRRSVRRHSPWSKNKVRSPLPNRVNCHKPAKSGNHGRGDALKLDIRDEVTVWRKAMGRTDHSGGHPWYSRPRRPNQSVPPWVDHQSRHCEGKRQLEKGPYKVDLNRQLQLPNVAVHRSKTVS